MHGAEYKKALLLERFFYDFQMVNSGLNMVCASVDRASTAQSMATCSYVFGAEAALLQDTYVRQRLAITALIYQPRRQFFGNPTAKPNAIDRASNRLRGFRIGLILDGYTS